MSGPRWSARSAGPGCEARFSTEDSFRSDPDDLVRIYRAIDRAGVDRVGLADTVGVATPPQVHDLVSLVRRNVGCDIEFHAHDDTGCAVANALAALEAGATHVDTTILGIGERNGIVPLSAMMARLVTLQPELVEHYRLEMLPELDAMLAEMLGIAVPFNAAVTAPTAFHHKAGMHTKAVLLDPGAYEVLDPAQFGRERSILAGHRLAGRHAIGDRASALGVRLDDADLRRLTAEVKRRGDDGPLDVEDARCIDRQLGTGIGDEMGTITEELFSRRLGRPVHAGDTVIAEVDVAMAHDVTGPLAIDAFRSLDLPLWDASRIVFSFDHVMPANTVAAAELHRRSGSSASSTRSPTSSPRASVTR